MSVRVNGRFSSAMKLTCWVWLVALGSAGVANAEMPQLTCTGYPFNGLGTSTVDECNAVAAAFNKLDGVSGVVCDHSTYLETDTVDGCNAAAAAFNKLDGVSGVTCSATSFFTVHDHCDAVAGRLTAILRAEPTCIEDGCVTGDFTKDDAKKQCCHKGHETGRCKDTHWRCDPPTALRGRAFEFPQQQV